MTDRPREILRFLSENGWEDASLTALAGDASRRRYLRVQRRSRRAILMDAPPATCGSQVKFLAVDAFLREQGLSAPGVLAADTALGFVLMEDLGDGIFSREAALSKAAETRLYKAAIDVLLALRSSRMEGLETVDAPALAEMVRPAFSQYCPGAGKDVPEAEANRLIDLFQSCLSPLLEGTSCAPTLRDYHAGNLIWLPDRSGPAQVGLLDFQDAICTHPVYDLVSLLQDARRDLAPGLEDHLIARYLRKSGEDRTQFQALYRAIGAQRHLRILGVFARLAREEGKTGYLQYIARTWRHLVSDLDHPCLRKVAVPLLQTLPDPTPDRLKLLAGS